MKLPQSIRGRAVLVDTSAFYALLDRSDQWHEEAQKRFAKLTTEGRALVATNLIVTETQVLTMARLGDSVARAWLGAVKDINLFFESEMHHVKVLDLLSRYKGAGFSYTDAFSFVAMEELRLEAALAFDKHFAQFGCPIYD